MINNKATDEKKNKSSNLIADFNKKVKQDFKENWDKFEKNLPKFKHDPTKEIKTFKPKEESKVFLTKKRVFLFGLMIILVVVLSGITVAFVTGISVGQIVTTVAEIQNHTKGIIAGWILLLILSSFTRLVWQIEVIRFRLKHYYIKVKGSDWWNFGIIVVFINTVTIFAIGSDPYKMWWLTKKGLPLYEANAIILSSGWMIQISQMLVSYPSLGFAIYEYFYDAQFFHHSYDSYIAMILVATGYCNDVIVFCGLTILGFSKKLQYNITRIFNWIRKKIGLTYKSREVLEEEFVQKNKFQNAFLTEIKSFEADMYTIFWTIASLLTYYFSMFFAWELVVPYDPAKRIHIIAETFWNIYNFTNISSVANNFIPIPGSEGTLQFVMIAFFDASMSNYHLSNNHNLNTTIRQSVFLWRVFNYYLIAIFGALYCIVYGLIAYFKKRKIRLLKQKNSWFQKV